jgi:hypothetical protein
LGQPFSARRLEDQDRRRTVSVAKVDAGRLNVRLNLSLLPARGWIKAASFLNLANDYVEDFKRKVSAAWRNSSLSIAAAILSAAAIRLLSASPLAEATTNILRDRQRPASAGQIPAHWACRLPVWARPRDIQPRRQSPHALWLVDCNTNH